MAAVYTCSELKYIFTVTPEQRNALLSSQHTDDLQHVLQPLKDTLDEHGFVLVRGLLDEPLQQRICNAAQTIASAPKKSGNMFTSLEFGPVFNIESVFREVSLNSAIPSLVARLLQTDEQSSTLRLLKDAFMAKGRNSKERMDKIEPVVLRVGGEAVENEPDVFDALSTALNNTVPTGKRRESLGAHATPRR